MSFLTLVMLSLQIVLLTNIVIHVKMRIRQQKAILLHFL